MSTVTVVIPCRNEEDYIALCLDSLVNCDFPKDRLKVVVCDGMSTDGTRTILEKYSKQHSFIFWLDNPQKTTPFALNLGIKKYPADVSIILGAHAEIYSDYICNCLKAFEMNKSIGCAGGIIENINEDLETRAIGMSMASPFGVGNAHFRTGGKEGYVDTVAFGAYRKEVFDRVGYFDERLTRNQDDEFNFRVIRGGFKIYLSKKIRAKYYVRSSYKKLYRQYYQYGYWKVFISKKHRTFISVRQLVPLGFVLFLFLGAVLSFIHPVFYGLYLAGIAIYMAGAFFFATKQSDDDVSTLKIVKTFIILHFSYGLGQLEGVKDFLILNKQPTASHEMLTR